MAESIFQGGTSASETLTGSTATDVLYGQGGNDHLIGGDGNDGLNSGEYLIGDTTVFDYLGDWLDGGNGNDALTGGSGADFLIGGAGTNNLSGGDGYDTAIYAGVSTDYTVTMFNDMPARVTANAGGVTDTLVSVERLAFSDKAIAYDIEGNAGNLYRLYRAAFDRVPDEGGLGFWISVADRNVSSSFIASSMMDSDEFRDLYGTNLTDEQFLTNAYDNVLHRAYDQGGFDYWIGVMRDLNVARADVLNFIAQSAENRAAVIGDIQDGIEYTLYTA